MTRAEILVEVEKLKRKQPFLWKSKAQQLLNKLAEAEGIFEREHPKIVSEKLGRKIHRTDLCPVYDRMGDNSFP